MSISSESAKNSVVGSSKVSSLFEPVGETLVYKNQSYHPGSDKTFPVAAASSSDVEIAAHESDTESEEESPGIVTRLRGIFQKVTGGKSTRTDTKKVTGNDGKVNVSKGAAHVMNTAESGLQKQKKLRVGQLSEEIAGRIPLDLIKAWNNGERTVERQKELLKPFIISGIAVSSDSAGLSKISGSRPLLEVLWLIHQPKELIFARGRMLGGRAVGIWAADNTFMFYPTDSCTASDVIATVVQAQEENCKRNKIQIGIGLHMGDYVCFGDQVFGADADLVEELAEEFTRGGDVFITDSLVPAVQNDKRFSLTDFSIEPLNLVAHAVKSTSDLTYPQPEIVDFSPLEMYPAAFSKDFYSFLRAVPLDNLMSRLNEVSQFSRNTSVVLLKVKHDHENAPLLLDTLTECLLAKDIIMGIAKSHSAELIKCDGVLGIFLFNPVNPTDDGTDHNIKAFNFSKDTKQELEERGLKSSYGIAFGNCFVFPLSNGELDIAGNAVNVASKFAEDSGLDGIFAHDSASGLTNGAPISIKLSGVELNGYDLTIR